ncbi:MAG: GDSL-type esterase/lipase family protein [Methanospirillum sp.]
MKLNVFIIVLAMFACAGAIAAGAEHADASVKIAPIGDSITHGGKEADSPYPSYRYYLWTMLRNGGYDVDFVGSTTDPNFQKFVFDQDHDGYSGYTTELLANDMDRMLTSYTPDIVLLYIGTNDVLQQVPMNDRMRNIDRIVTSLRQKNPNVRILLAQIAPTSDTFRNTNSGLDEYNDNLLSYAQRTTSAASPIVIVDMNTAWSTTQFLQADGVHPNTEGEVQMAQRWANALVSTGMITPAVPTQAPVTVAPTPAPTVIPTAVPTAIITTAPTQAPATIAPAVSPTRSAFGSKRYVLQPGAAGSGLSSSRSSTSVSAGSSRSSQSGTTNPLVPPTHQFQRWYPGQRWAAGLH